MNQIKKIVVVGAGVMGRGIAQVCGAGGYEVWLVDLEEGILQKAFQTIKSNLDWMAKNGLTTKQEAQSAFLRVKGSLNLEETAREADCVIESVPEDTALKKEIFHYLDQACGQHTLLLTNTSSLRISELAGVTTRPDKVAGFHWINPPYIVPVVELIAGEKTSDSTVNKIKKLSLKLGKIPVVCKDVPGFIVNRLQMALLNEAISLLEQGVAKAEDIDNAFRLGIGMRLPLWGPLRINDLVGNKKTTLALLEYLHKETGNEKFRAPALLREKVDRGELGLMSGKGWYDFSKETPDDVIQKRDKLIAEMAKFLKKQGLAE